MSKGGGMSQWHCNLGEGEYVNGWKLCLQFALNYIKMKKS